MLTTAEMMQIGEGTKEGYGGRRKGISSWNGGAVLSTHGGLPCRYGATYASQELTLFHG